MTAIVGDEDIADKLVANGVNEPAKLEGASREDLAFLTDAEYAALNGKSSKTASKPEEPEQQADEADTAESDPAADNEFEALPDDAEFPYHYGGGNYFLSDGSKIRGKKAAEQAQESLNEG